MTKYKKLDVFFQEASEVDGDAAKDWLIKQAQGAGVNLGVIIRSTESFGDGFKLQEDKFFELQGKTLVQLEIYGEEEKITLFLAAVEKTPLRACISLSSLDEFKFIN